MIPMEEPVFTGIPDAPELAIYLQAGGNTVESYWRSDVGAFGWRNSILNPRVLVQNLLFYALPTTMDDLRRHAQQTIDDLAFKFGYKEDTLMRLSGGPFSLAENFPPALEKYWNGLSNLAHLQEVRNGMDYSLYKDEYLIYVNGQLWGFYSLFLGRTDPPLNSLPGFGHTPMTSRTADDVTSPLFVFYCRAEPVIPFGKERIIESMLYRPLSTGDARIQEAFLKRLDSSELPFPGKRDGI